MKAANETMQAAGDPQHHTKTAEVARQQPVRLSVSELMSGGRETILEHAGQDYRLRITANGKLILTK